MNHARKRWLAAIGAAFLLAGLTTGASAAAASADTTGGPSAAEQPTQPFGGHTPTAAERRALPTALRDVTVAVSGPYWIQNENSGLYMEVYASSTSNGGKVVQWTYNGNKNQKWILADTGNYQVSLINVNSSKCLDDTGHIADYVQMYQWTCTSGNPHQVFYLYRVPNTTRYVMTLVENQNYCVEVKNSSKSKGAPVNLYHCNGTRTQQWYFWLVG
jgi:hypothetical protein